MHIRVSPAALRLASQELRDANMPVTVTRLARKTRVKPKSLWYVLKRSAPWLAKEVSLVRGRRDDDRVTYQAFSSAIQRVHKRHGFAAYVLVGEELGRQVGEFPRRAALGVLTGSGMGQLEIFLGDD